MPKDFGEWMGNAAPMDFNDPGDLPSSKPAAKRVKCDGNHGGPACSDPECWHNSAHLTEGYSYVQRPRSAGKSTSVAMGQLQALGFSYHAGPDCFKNACLQCAQPILVAASQASDYLRAHYTFGSDPRKCLHCNGVKVGSTKAKP